MTPAPGPAAAPLLDAPPGPWARLAATLRARETWTAWAMLLPALLGLGLFYGWPAVRAVQISFTDWNLLRPAHDVGWANYARLLQDERFWRGLELSAYYVLLNIPLQTVLGLFLAVAMDRLSRSLFVKAVVLLPYLLSNVLVALIWLWLLDPVLGVVNHALIALGVGAQPFFAGPDQALLSVAAVNVWRHMGLVAMLFLAGLQNIPRSLYEAAALEGASEWQAFRRITLPLLRPVMVFVLVTSVTGSIQIFDTVAVTTQGGPAGSTAVIVQYIVQNAFGYLKMGYASAMSMVLCGLMLAYTVIQMRVMRADTNDLA